jgi:hypothetical protein
MVGIAGAKLGMTRPEVRTRLGDPLDVVHGKNDFGNFTIFEYFRLTVTFQGNAGATAVETTRRRQKTPRGIHVGSTARQLRKAYPHVRCRTETGDFRHCWLGSFRPGKRVTDFRVSNRHVKRITIAFVID